MQKKYDKLCYKSLNFWEKVAVSRIFNGLYRWLDNSRDKLSQCRINSTLANIRDAVMEEALKILRDTKSQTDDL